MNRKRLSGKIKHLLTLYDPVTLYYVTLRCSTNLIIVIIYFVVLSIKLKHVTRNEKTFTDM